MRKRLFITVSILAMASLLLSVPVYSQDKELLVKADSLQNEGRNLFENEQYEDAIKLLNEAARIRREQSGEASEEYVTLLGEIGVCYLCHDDYQLALDYLNNARLLFEKVIGKENADYTNFLFLIGTCYGLLGDYAKALEPYQQSLPIVEKNLGKNHSEYAKILNSIGECYDNLGDYAKAMEYYRQLLPVIMKVTGDDNMDYASVLYSIGICCFNLGNFSRALDFFKHSLSIKEKLNGTDNPYTAATLNNIGLSYSKLGDHSNALEYYQRALTVYEGIYGADHPDYATTLNNIGGVYLDLGDYAKALEYSQRTLAVYKKVYGVDYPLYALSLDNIGSCYSDLGDFAKALEYHQQALVIWKKVYGKAHPDYAICLNNIGSCYSDLGNYAKALECYQRSLSICEKVYGTNHPDYALCLNNLGLCYQNLGKCAKALGYLRLSLSFYEKMYGSDHPLYAFSLNNIGACYDNLRNYNKALDCYQQSLAICEKRYGTTHPSYAICLNNIGGCYRYLGDKAKASESYTLYSEIVSSIVTKTFSSLTESQRAMFWEKYSGFFTDNLYFFVTTISTPEMSRTAYDGALLGKGLLLNAETEMRKLIFESGDDEALQMYNEVQESRIRLDKIYEDPVGKRGLIDSLNNDIEVRQQALMKRSKAFGDYTRNLALKWTDVQSALGRKDIAIEFETYTHKDTTFYIALTLRPGYTEPHLVKLFDSKELGQISPKRYYTSTSMTELVWGKLAEELNGVKNVYFSPAGELNNIGIEYLLDEDGKHLISEKRNYYRLTSTRELAKEYTGKKMADATLYGGIRYDISPSSNLTGEETESERLARTATRSWMPMDSLSVTRGGWVYLPGTKEEAEAISSTLSSKKVQNDLLEGENGTEESFKALSGAKKDVIHIATHGFYWTETEATRSGMETSSFMLSGDSQAPKEDKALTRSGLLFAGAQNAFEGKDIPIDVEDGILTAKDISRMDLRGTDLVVISACQSGLGEVTGDGVFGLQRGFKKAGVQSIVMSLWEVNDEATMIMMTRFYENLAKGKSKYDAFREAQKHLRKYDNGIYDEPEYYAAFVLLDAID